ncbi:MAG: FkbM family methyltransferase [Patescibacteria group bacterium]
MFRQMLVIFRKLKYLKIYWLIKVRLSSNSNFFWVQIGSNNGKAGAILYYFSKIYKWHGLLVEPVQYLFEELKENYRNSPDIAFENIAISDHDGVETFYRVEKNNEPGNPRWYEQLGSFHKEVVLKHRCLVPNIDKHLISERIPVMSFQNLLKKYAVGKIDLLHIDTEGHDYQIIQNIPFATIKPKMILYEYRHLSPRDDQICKDLLTSQGYSIIQSHSDNFAYLPNTRNIGAALGG